MFRVHDSFPSYHQKYHDSRRYLSAEEDCEHEEVKSIDCCLLSSVALLRMSVVFKQKGLIAEQLEQQVEAEGKDSMDKVRAEL